MTKINKLWIITTLCALMFIRKVSIFDTWVFSSNLQLLLQCLFLYWRYARTHILLSWYVHHSFVSSINIKSQCYIYCDILFILRYRISVSLCRSLKETSTLFYIYTIYTNFVRIQHLTRILSTFTIICNTFYFVIGNGIAFVTY